MKEKWTLHIITAVVFVVFIILGLACASNPGSFTVSGSADLSKYNYATISNVMDYRGSPELMDLEVKIYDALSVTRLTLIGDKEIDTLSEDQKQELLLVRFSAEQKASPELANYRSYVTINFVEYISGKPVASCHGDSSGKLTSSTQADMEVAFNKVLAQVKKIF